MNTEQQIEQRVINIITDPKSTIRCVKNNTNYTLIVSSGKKELHIASHWLVDDERMWVVIYRNHLWGLFKTEIDEIDIHSRKAASILRTAKAKKVAEEAEEREEREEKKRRAILSFLNP